MTTVDYPDFGDHAHQSLAIYNQKVPLARSASSMGGQVTQTLAAGSGVTLVNQVVVDQPSVQLVVSAQLPAGALGTPFVKASLTWLDTVTSDPIVQKSYINASGNGQANIARLIGPVRGDTLTVLLSNLHATQAVTFDWSVSAISHVYGDDDWANDGPAPVSGFTSPSAVPQLGVLAFINATLTPGGPAARLTPASNRRCKVVTDNTGQANACMVTVSDPAPSISLYGDPAGVVFYNSGSVAAGGVKVDEFQMPNGPVLVTASNLGGAGNIAPKVSIITMTGTTQ